MSARIVFRNRRGGEVEINLHPISLALLVSEVIEESARSRCRRKGHAEANDGFCERCGLSLPDDGSPFRAWLPDAYRTIRDTEATS